MHVWVTWNKKYKVSVIPKTVYDLKFVGPLEFELAAPMTEQLKTTAMHFYEASRNPYYNVPPDTSGKCIVCSGMGATNLKFWVLRS